jgi:hypothetical protein
MNKDEIVEWCKKYDLEEDKYNKTLELKLGNKLRSIRELDKNDLISIFEWKFQGRLLGRRNRLLKLVKNVDDSTIKKIINTALNMDDDKSRIKKLMEISGVGVALASVVLTFHDPKKYGVFDIHVYDEVFCTDSKTRPKDLFSNLNYYIEFLRRLRGISNEYCIDVRVVEKALFKKNLDKS